MDSLRESYYKKQLTKDIGLLSLVCVCFIFLQLGIQIVLEIILLIVYRNPTEASNVLISLYSYTDVKSLIFSISTYCFTFLPFLLYMLFRKKTFKEEVRFDKTSPIKTICAFFITMSATYIFSNIFAILYTILERFGAKFPDFTINAPSDPLGIVLFYICIAVLPAIFEELTFRGIIMGGILKYNQTAAIIFSAFIFGTIHLTFQQIPMAFAMGICVAYFSIKFNSIRLGIVIHFINNAFSATLTIIQPLVKEEIYTLIAGLWSLAIMSLGLIFTLIYVFVFKLNLPKNTSEAAVSNKTASKAVFSSPLLYCYAVIVMAYMIFSYIVL